MHECCTITIGRFNHGTCHGANQHHNFTLEITQRKTVPGRAGPAGAIGECVHSAAAGSTLSREGPAGRTDGQPAGRTAGQPDGRTHCCDFVVHRCPCLMAPWLFLSRCCDNAKCPFYERERSSSPSTVNNPPPQTACPQQTGHAMKNNLLLSLGVHLHTFTLNV